MKKPLMIMTMPGNYYLLITNAPEHRFFRLDPATNVSELPKGCLVLMPSNFKEMLPKLYGPMPFWETFNKEFELFSESGTLAITFWSLPRWGID